MIYDHVFFRALPGASAPFGRVTLHARATFWCRAGPRKVPAVQRVHDNRFLISELPDQRFADLRHSRREEC